MHINFLWIMSYIFAITIIKNVYEPFFTKK